MNNQEKMQEIEQKLRLSVSNILSIITMIGSLIIVYSTLNSRIAILEKESLENKEKYGQLLFKLDKIIESNSRISIDIAVLKTRNETKEETFKD